MIKKPVKGSVLNQAEQDVSGTIRIKKNDKTDEEESKNEGFPQEKLILRSLPN